jgi:hypothetical protein
MISLRRSVPVAPLEQQISPSVNAPVGPRMSSFPFRHDLRSALVVRVSQLANTLEEAHEIGLRRRRRLQRPLYGAALVLVGGSIAIGVRTRLAGHGALDLVLLFAQALSVMAALACLLVSLQPGDVRAARFALVGYATVSVCISGLFVARYFALRSLELAHGHCSPLRAAASRHACWSHRELEVFVLLVALVSCAAALTAARGAVSPLSVRARISWIWRISGVACLVVAVFALATVVIQAATGAFEGGGAGALVGSVALACACLVIAALALSTRLRARIHGFVATRGEAVERAAVIAALLVSRSVEEARVLACASLRMVSLDKLRAADLERNQPGASGRLYALSAPAQLGDVDVRADEATRRRRRR